MKVLDLEVVGVRVEMPSNTPIVLLRDRAGGRYLPIWVGAVEATAIAYAQQGIVPPRPLTHDLFLTLFGRLKVTLTRVVITDLRDDIFYATVYLTTGGPELQLDARPSDAIALAVRMSVPIFAQEDVLAEASILIPGDEEEEVEKFREFLDNVRPEDFDG